MNIVAIGGDGTINEVSIKPEEEVDKIKQNEEI
jgi:diacylglycerol kinase family enzyme